MPSIISEVKMSLLTPLILMVIFVGKIYFDLKRLIAESFVLSPNYIFAT